MGGALSHEQKEIIRRAVEEGYFEVPRRTSLVKLSERLGMSDAEASAELRRALNQYLRDEFLKSESQ